MGEADPSVRRDRTEGDYRLPTGPVLVGTKSSVEKWEDNREGAVQPKTGQNSVEARLQEKVAHEEVQQEQGRGLQEPGSPAHQDQGLLCGKRK